MSQTSGSKTQTPGPESQVAGVRFQPTGKVYCFDASDQQGLRPGDFVLVETARGQQLGEVVSVRSLGEGEDEGLKPVQRRATGRDLALRQDPYFDYGQALLQIAIVLASIAIISGGTMLLGVSGLLGALGTLLTLNGFMLIASLPYLG